MRNITSDDEPGPRFDVSRERLLLKALLSRCVSLTRENDLLKDDLIYLRSRNAATNVRPVNELSMTV